MITILAIGKKHEDWVADATKRYQNRLRAPFDTRWVLLPHSAREGTVARDDESERILSRLAASDHVILLDETGQQLDSPTLANRLNDLFARGQHVVIVIGGAYGVNTAVMSRADTVLSLSKMVFPHQLVRPIIIEQLYRSQQILAGHPYHHA